MRVFAAALLIIGMGAAVSGCPLDPFTTPGCRMAGASCDDGNGCTIDSCDEDTGLCVFEPMGTGSDCGDGDLCNGIERCSPLNECRVEETLEIDDGDACTIDACDARTGVTHEPIAECGATFWTPLPGTGAPSRRTRHTAVWTGSEMIVWGGRIAPGVVTNTGARYSPAENAWSPVSASGAPAPRHSHSAIWTGTRMIVWGGFGDADYETSGGIYDPATDSWTAMNDAGAPQGRTFQSAVWTGSEMIVWGGFDGNTPMSSGGRYDIANDAWTATAGGAPSARLKHMAVWTGTHMIVWGGTDTFDWFDDGRYYDPESDAWTGDVNGAGAPVLRESASAAWTGAAMLLWGGWDGGNYLTDGALLDPAGPSGGTWTPIAADGPGGRGEHVSLWTGTELFVWGGCTGNGCGIVLGDGGRYDARGAWHLIDADPGLSPRVQAAAVWTGNEVLVWGGQNDGGINGLLGDGARATLE